MIPARGDRGHCFQCGFCQCVDMTFSYMNNISSVNGYIFTKFVRLCQCGTCLNLD